MTEIKIGKNLETLVFDEYIKQSGQPNEFEITNFSIYEDYNSYFEINKIDNGCFQDAKYWKKQQSIITNYYCSGYTDNFGELNYTVAYDYDAKTKKFNINLKNISLNFLKKRYNGMKPKITLSITIEKVPTKWETTLANNDSAYSDYTKILDIIPPGAYTTTSIYSFSVRGEYTRNKSNAFREDTWVPITLDYQYGDKKDLLFYRTVKIGKATAEDQNTDQDANDNTSTVFSKPVLPTLTQEGYIFKGWNTKSNNTGTNYNAGQEFSSITPTTLYAIWEKERNFTPYIKVEDSWIKANAVYVNTNYDTPGATPNWVEVKNVFKQPYD